MQRTGWVGLALVLGLAACGSETPQATTYGKRPDWSITLKDGKTASAADYDGKVVIVDFWATWCPPCVQEIPGFIRLQDQYGGKGLKIVGFSFDRDEAKHDGWVKEKGMNYLSIFAQNEAGRKIVEQFQEKIGVIEGLPTTLVIDRKGTIVYKHVGYASPEEFEKVIQPLF